MLPQFLHGGHSSRKNSLLLAFAERFREYVARDHGDYHARDESGGDRNVATVAILSHSRESDVAEAILRRGFSGIKFPHGTSTFVTA